MHLLGFRAPKFPTNEVSASVLPTASRVGKPGFSPGSDTGTKMYDICRVTILLWVLAVPTRKATIATDPWSTLCVSLSLQNTAHHTQDPPCCLSSRTKLRLRHIRQGPDSSVLLPAAQKHHSVLCGWLQGLPSLPGAQLPNFGSLWPKAVYWSVFASWNMFTTPFSLLFPSF